VHYTLVEFINFLIILKLKLITTSPKNKIKMRFFQAVVLSQLILIAVKSFVSANVSINRPKLTSGAKSRRRRQAKPIKIEERFDALWPKNKFVSRGSHKKSTLAKESKNVPHSSMGSSSSYRSSSILAYNRI